MTHKDLIPIAAKWLASAHQCGVVLTEFHTQITHEIPDAIGWCRRCWSVLVECKATRADFLKDKKKKSRDKKGMGQERWYLAPSGIIKPEEVPDGWGLAEFKNNKVYKTVVPEHSYLLGKNRYRKHRDPKIALTEMPLLLSSLRRFSIDKGLDVLERKLTVSGPEVIFEDE